MFKRIMLPVDGSENSNKAIQYAIETAKTFDSEIILLHTFNTPLPEYIPYNFDTKELEEKLLISCKEILNQAEEKFKNAGLKFKSFLKEGPAGFTIERTVKTEGCDAIIMGSRSASSLNSTLISSVSNYVVHHVKIPTLLIN